MKFEVLENITLKTGNGNITLQKGQTVEVQPEKVKKLVESGKLQPLPHIQNDTLIISHNSAQKYHWWNRGQGIDDTLRGLGASDEIFKRYQSPYSDN